MVSFVILLLMVVILLLWALIIIKKKEFNSIVIGTKIYYPTTMLEDMIGNSFEEDIVVYIEYDESKKVKCIKTKKGLTFTFYEFVRDNFFLYLK